MQLAARIKNMFNPKSRKGALSHYIPAPDYAADAVENSVWRSDLQKPFHDWKGNTGRIPYRQVLTFQGPLLFALPASKESGLGGYGSIAFGQSGTAGVAGFAGRPAQLDSTSVAAEYEAINQ